MKKSDRIKKINSKNFLEAVEFTKKLKYKIITHLRIRAIALPLGCILFLVFSVLFTFGFLSSTIEPYSTFIPQKFPFVSDFWAEFIVWCNGITTVWYWQLLICLVLLYAIPFVVFSIVVLLIRVLTRVSAPSMEGDHIKQVNQLYEYCSNIRCSNKQDWSFHAICSRITTLCFLVILIAYDIYALVLGEEALLFVFLSIPLYFLYGLFINLFILSIKFYYRDKNEDYYDFSSYRQTYFTLVISEYRAKVDPVIRARFEEHERAERAKREKEEREKKELEGKIAEAYLNGWRPPKAEEPKPYSALDDDMDMIKIDVSDM